MSLFSVAVLGGGFQIAERNADERKMATNLIMVDTVPFAQFQCRRSVFVRLFTQAQAGFRRVFAALLCACKFQGGQGLFSLDTQVGQHAFKELDQRRRLSNRQGAKLRSSPLARDVVHVADVQVRQNPLRGEKPLDLEQYAILCGRLYKGDLRGIAGFLVADAALTIKKSGDICEGHGQ